MATPAHTVTVTDVQHYTDSYFRLRTTRPAGLRFVSGQFIMLGMQQDDRPLMRAYSIASACWDEELEFYFGTLVQSLLTHFTLVTTEGWIWKSWGSALPARRCTPMTARSGEPLRSLHFSFPGFCVLSVSFSS